ncbi:MAG: ribosomal protein S18-alanine N-acetyltransferase [Dehalococcoidales bacterium]|jgi:ribosomal-protein-alanine N-acetyltransferase|nr:ribosomal protein S18-alanine N-acetyltransferase [Dehalococcoidales bacterium]
MRYHIRLMRQEDALQMADIAREAFPTAQPPTNYQREYRNPLAHYIVVLDTKSGDGGPVRYMAGYAGFWLIAGEAHIVDIAVREAYRRQGLGESLLICLLDLAVVLNAVKATLEVRASNQAAITLYEKYGFVLEGRRRRYYLDNNEDALIMTVADICQSEYQELLEKQKKTHAARWGFKLYPIIR